MKKAVLQAFVIATMVPVLLFADQVTKQYDFSTPTMNRDGEIVLPGCELGLSSGAPAVPTKNVMLLLPAGQKPVSFDVSFQPAQMMRGSYDVKPISFQVRLDGEPTQAQQIYRAPCYSVNAFYPADIKSPGFTYSTIHGYNIFLASINPVQYNPVTGELRSYSSMTVTVTTSTDNSPVHQIDAAQKHYISTLIDNPEALDNVSVRSSKKPNDYDYLIITTDALSKGFTEFVEFNKQRALKTKIETIENISKLQGENTQDKIRTYIKSQYDSCHIGFVLIAGDDDKIPARGMRSITHDYDTLYTPSSDDFDFKNIADDDMYYGGLTGTWKKGNSQYYGEFGSEDPAHEVFVGRIAIDNETDQKNVLNKIMMYSKEPVVEGITNALFLGEALWGKGTGNKEEWPKGMYGDECMEELKGECNNHYSTKGFTNDFTFDKIYGKENKNWQNNSALLLKKLKDFKPAWINHLGHANLSTVMSFKRDADITTTNLTNDGKNANFYIVYSQGCYPGSYDNNMYGNPINVENTNKNSGDCIAERWNTIATGACAVLMNTRFGFGASQSTNGSAQRLQRFFHSALFEQNLYHIGAMLAYSKDKNAPGIMDSVILFNKNDKKQGWNSYFGQLKWQAYEVNLLGDPAMSVWSKKPQTLEPKLPQTISSGAVEFQAQPFARVGFIDSKGEVITTAVADNKGLLKINDELLAKFVKQNGNADIKVTIAAMNYKLYQGTVKIDATAITNIANAQIKFSAHLRNAQNRITFFYTIPSAQKISLSIYALNGRCLMKQTQNIKQAGTYSFIAPTNAFTNGCYYAELSTESTKAGLKFSLVK